MQDSVAYRAKVPPIVRASILQVYAEQLHFEFVGTVYGIAAMPAIAFEPSRPLLRADVAERQQYHEEIANASQRHQSQVNHSMGSAQPHTINNRQSKVIPE
jgi:hypothetical protein